MLDDIVLRLDRATAESLYVVLYEAENASPLAHPSLRLPPRRPSG